MGMLFFCELYVIRDELALLGRTAHHPRSCVEPRPLAQAGPQGDSLLACGTRQRRRPSRLERARRREAHWTVVAPLSPV